MQIENLPTGHSFRHSILYYSGSEETKLVDSSGKIIVLGTFQECELVKWAIDAMTYKRRDARAMFHGKLKRIRKHLKTLHEKQALLGKAKLPLPPIADTIEQQIAEQQAYLDSFLEFLSRAWPTWDQVPPVCPTCGHQIKA